MDMNRRLWSVLVQSFKYHSPNELNGYQFKMGTRVDKLFNYNEQSLERALLNIVSHFRNHEKMEHMYLDIPKEQQIKTFIHCRDVFIYFYLKIYKVETIANDVILKFDDIPK